MLCRIAHSLLSCPGHIEGARSYRILRLPLWLALLSWRAILALPPHPQFYSKRCRACLRIAAKYRSLATRFHDELDCYDMEQHAAGRHVLEALSVSQLPTIQIFDGAGCDRLASLPCQPAQFAAVEAQIVECIQARRQELAQFATMGGIMGRAMLEETRSQNAERMFDALVRDDDADTSPGVVGS